jgi:hypothetical protein
MYINRAFRIIAFTEYRHDLERVRDLLAGLGLDDSIY